MGNKCKFFILFFYIVSLLPLEGQIPQELIEKAKAAGISDSQIQQELSKVRQSSGNQLFNEPVDTLSTTAQRTIKNDEFIPSVEEQRDMNIPEIDLSKTVFGREIFTNKELSFEPSLDIPTPKDYRLAAGDEIFINVWGDSEMNITRTISPEGIIIIPALGPISLSGFTIEQAQIHIRHGLRRIISDIGEESNTFVSVSLGKIRSVKVHIVGEAFAPGTYTLPSLATLFNALYAAGGVNDIGSLRNIRVFRNNKEVANLDVYDYLLYGRYDANIRLENNDMIIIDPYQQLVTVSGKVKRNRIFEVKENETLQNVLKMAGGFSGDAYTKDVRIRRKTGQRYRIATVTSDRFGDFLMHDGDSLIVDSVIPHYENRLTINGAVWRPGEYELSENIKTVKSLVELAGGLKGDEFTGRAQLTRLNDDFTTSVFAVDLKGIFNGTSPDVILKSEDVLYIPSLFDLREEYTFTVSGAVNEPAIFPFSHNLTVEDAIIMAGGLMEAAATVNVEVARRIKKPDSYSAGHIIAEQFIFTLSDNMEVITGEPLFTLEPFDEIFVRFSPGYSNQQVVRVRGEISFAGDYVLSVKNSRLSDLILQAGGITPDAYVRGASLKRHLSEDEMRRLETMLELSAHAEGRDSISIDDIDLQTYSVGIDLEKALMNPGSVDDLVLRDGDELYIPQFQSTVKISGAVAYPNSVTYTKNMSVKDCLSQAGDYNDIARKYPIVVYMNGKVSTTRKRFLHKKYPKVEPGCEIIVPSKSITDKRMSTTEILGIASSTTSMAAMITSLINTFNK